MSDPTKYVVVGEPILHAGLERKPGSEILLSDEAAEVLLDEERVAKAGSKDAKVAESASEKPLEDLTVKELRTLAGQRDVDLAGLKSKEDIILRLREAGAADDDE